MHLCKMYLIDDRSNAHIIEGDLFTTIEALQKVATQSQRPPEGIVSLIEMIKMSSERLEQSLAMSGPTAQLHSGIGKKFFKNYFFMLILVLMMNFVIPVIHIMVIFVVTEYY